MREAVNYGGQWHERFLRQFALNGTVSAAAKAAGINRKTVYKALQNDQEFKEQFEDCKADFVERLEKEAVRRAVSGTKRTKGVYYEGARIATETETQYSDTLMIFLLKANAPDKYREPVQRYAQTDAQGNDIDYTSIESRADRTMALLEQARARRDRDAGSTGEGDLDAVSGDAAD